MRSGAAPLLFVNATSSTWAAVKEEEDRSINRSKTKTIYLDTTSNTFLKLFQRKNDK